MISFMTFLLLNDNVLVLSKNILAPYVTNNESVVAKFAIIVILREKIPQHSHLNWILVYHN